MKKLALNLHCANAGLSQPIYRPVRGHFKTVGPCLGDCRFMTLILVSGPAETGNRTCA
jgi:hypothetical protein